MEKDCDVRELKWREDGVMGKERAERFAIIRGFERDERSLSKPICQLLLFNYLINIGPNVFHLFFFFPFSTIILYIRSKYRVKRLFRSLIFT